MAINPDNAGRLGYSVGDLPLGQPGVAAANYGVNEDNVFDWMTKLWQGRGDKRGGSKVTFEKMMRWASPEQVRSRGGNPNDLQWQLLRQWGETGVIDPRLNPTLAVRGYDLGLAENARRMQHKDIGLLERIASVAAPIALSAIPTIGPYLGAASGGYIGSRHGGGALGALLGAAGGYYSGTQIANAGGIGNYASNLVNSAGNFIRHPIATLTGEGSSIAPGAIRPGWEGLEQGVGALNQAAGAASGAASGAAGGAASGAAGGFAGRALPYLVGAAALAPALGGAGGTPIGDAAYSADAINRELRGTGQRNVNRAFSGLNDDYYGGLRNDIYRLQMHNLNERMKDEARETKFELARRGHLGGSPQIEANADLNRLYNEGRLNAGRLADEVVLGARQADEIARVNAQRDILGGMDASQATGHAINNARLQTQQLSDAARGQNLGDIFYGASYLYNQRNRARDAARGVAAYNALRGGGTAPGAASSDSGRIYS